MLLIGGKSQLQSEGEGIFVLEMFIFIGKISVQKMFVYHLVPGIAVAVPEKHVPSFG